MPKLSDSGQIFSIKYPYLEKWISDHGLSMRSFANYCGMSCSQINKIMNGKSTPNKETIDLILKKTGMKYERCFAEKVQQQ